MRNDEDFRIEWFSGTGKGGQHRNKHQNSCRMIHIPTGLVQTAQTRSRQSSLLQAKKAILEELNNRVYNIHQETLKTLRTGQVGSGQRGDKIRTYRFQDNIVKDHMTEKTAPCDKVMAGNFDLLW